MTLAIPNLGDDAREIADEAFSFVQALPLEAHVAIGVMLLVGLGLWLFGAKLIKPLAAITGLVLGGLVGMIAVPALGVEEFAGQPGALVGLGLGAVLGLVVAMMALKAAIIVAAGASFAAVGFLGGAIYVSNNPLPDDSPPAFAIDDADRASDGRLLYTNPYSGKRMTIDELTATLREANSFLSGGIRTGGEEGEETPADDARLEAISARCEAIVREANDMLKRHWNALSTRERIVVSGATVGGLALGLLIGLVFPKKSTALISALAGSAIWLTAAVLLIDGYIPSMQALTDQPPTIWAFTWGAVFVLGLVIQMAGLGKPASEKAKKKPEASEEK